MNLEPVIQSEVSQKEKEQIPFIKAYRQNAWRTMDRSLWHCIWGSDQDYPQQKQMQKGKIAVWGGLINSWEKKRHKRQSRKGKIYLFECRVSKNSKER